LNPNYEPFYRNGQLTALDMQTSVRKRGMIRRFEMSLDLYLNEQSRFANFDWSDRAFREFEAILDLCRTKQIDVVVFVAPVHAAMLEAIFIKDLWPVFEKWKSKIATVSQFWDFSGYNSVTTEPMSFEMQHYWDISHYRSSVGDRIVTRIFDAETTPEKSEFGQLVTSENVQSHLKKTKALRALWRSANRDILALISRTLQSTN
jgi:hypothetical protein